MKTTATRRGTTEAEARRQRRAKASATGGALLVSLALLVLLLVSAVPAFAAILLEDQSLTSDTTEVSKPAEDATVVAEVSDSRTAYSREYELSDGSRKVEVYSEPVNYQDKDGSWQSFDGTLAASSLSEFAYENTKNAFKTYFTGDGDKRGTVRIEDGEFSLVFTPLGTAKAAGESGVKTNGSHDGVEYPGLFADTTASYSVMAGMLKEQLTLASASGPKAFRYRVEASGLTPQPQEDGSIAFLDENQTVHFVIRQPWAADSAQEPAIVNLSHSIRREGSAYMYEMTMDSEWLADKSRVFPVIVDPTVVTGSVAIDT
jgi:Tfp pilus assembly protein PilX